MPKVIRVSVPGLLVISMALLFSWWPGPQSAAKPKTPASLQILSLPYYSIKGDWESKLTLNNSSGSPLSVSVTLYSLDGRALTLPEVPLSPSQSTTLLLSEVVAQGKTRGTFQEGSVEVRFNAIPDAVGTQLTVFDPKHGLAFDMEPSMGSKSSNLEGLWWSLNERTRGRVMLSNTRSENLSVNASVEWHGTVIPIQPISLAPHQTEVLEIKNLLDGLNIHAEGIERGGLSVTYSGPPGALVMHGVVLNPEERFASNLRFLDPAAQPASVLEATGLLLGHPDPALPFSSASFFSPVLVLENASTSPQAATVTVQYTANGESQNKALPTVNLLPHEVRPVDFSGLLDSLEDRTVRSAGLKVEFSGKPGSLIGALSSIDRAGSVVVDAPLFNVDAKMYRGGNHPFHIAGDSQTVAYLKNVSTTPTTAIVIVRYADGEYTPPY